MAWLHISFVLLGIVLTSGVLGQDAECEGVENEDRVDCGDLSTQEQDCYDLNCCWEEQPEGVATPWCYYRPSDPCLSSPCVYGTCAANGTFYSCDCFVGYMGDNCDILDESICSATDRAECTPEVALCFEFGCCFDPEISLCYIWAGGPRGPEGENCVVDPAERLECGPGDGEPVRLENCLAAGCCWEPVEAAGAAWCFQSAGSSVTTEPPTVDPVCEIQDVERLECGFSGITPEECEALDCCWAPPETAGPWCFDKTGCVTWFR